MLDMLRIAVYEDNQNDLTRLIKILEGSNTSNTFKIYSFFEDLITAYKPYLYDLLIMGTYMNGISGIEAARIIRSINTSAVIAFATTSKNHTLEAYKLGALKYLKTRRA